jgi:hypothetical protein
MVLVQEEGLDNDGDEANEAGAANDAGSTTYDWSAFYDDEGRLYYYNRYGALVREGWRTREQDNPGFRARGFCTSWDMRLPRAYMPERSPTQLLLQPTDPFTSFFYFFLEA